MTNTDRYHLEGEAAQRYERDIVPTITKPQAELLLDHVPLYAGDRVLDVACGTGIVTRVAVQRCGALRNMTGLDLNPAMLDVARAHTPTTAVEVDWRQGDMCALPFPAHSFELGVCQHGLQFVTDKAAALRELQRVLVPGGRLACTVWAAANRQHAALADALRRHVHADAATSCLAPFAWCDAATIRQGVHAAGFQRIAMHRLVGTISMPASEDAVREFVAFIAARSPWAREVTAARMAIVQDVYATLHTYRQGDTFVMPTHTHLVQARAA